MVRKGKKYKKPRFALRGGVSDFFVTSRLSPQGDDEDDDEELRTMHDVDILSAIAVTSMSVLAIALPIFPGRSSIPDSMYPPLSEVRSG